MKRQGRQAEAFCSAPDPQSAAILLFGKPGAPIAEHVSQLGDTLLKASKDPMERKRVSYEDAKQDPGSIVDDLFSASLFGGVSLVEYTLQKESEAGPALDALKAIDERGEMPAGRLIVIAGDLGPRSKTRKAFEASKHATALQFFERTPQDFARWVEDHLRESQIEIEPDARQLLVQMLMEDQSLAESELGKLALFSDSLGRPLTTSDVNSLVALEDQSSHFELIDFALDGKTRELANMLPHIAMETAAIPLLIGLLNQLKRLSTAHEISASGIQGARIGEKLFPRIYERQWPAFDRRMRVWSPTILLSLANRVAEIDGECRRASSPQDALVGHLLLDIARTAQARAR